MQEAVKLIHGLADARQPGPDFRGTEPHFLRGGVHRESGVHEPLHVQARSLHLQQRSSEITLEELLARARTALDSPEVTIEFSRDVIQKLSCPHCGSEEECFVPVGSVTVDAGRCPKDGQLRTVITAHSYSGD